jgi:pyrroline-5-carboxylate reductase
MMTELPLEIERKFLIAMPPSTLLEILPHATITQTYLPGDANEEKREFLASVTGGVPVSLEEAVLESAYLFLGVKPQGFEGLFETLRPMLKERETAPVLVSMAAGVSIAAVEKLAGRACPISRIMPNTPVSVGEGMILYAHNELVNVQTLDDFCKALSAAGVLDAIPEDKIDAASALSGCGPAFVYLFAEALADGAVSCGLARDKAMLYAAQTLRGAAELLITSGKHPGELKDAVCSPGGTTIEGVKALENGAFRASAMGAVTAAYEKTLKLKK